MFLDDVRNIIYNNIGVLSVRGITVRNLTGNIGGREYSSVSYNVDTNLANGSILIPPMGGMFELKFPAFDLIGRVS